MTPNTGNESAREHQTRADGIAEFRRQESLLKTGTLQDAIFNSAHLSSIANDEKGVIQVFNLGTESNIDALMVTDPRGTISDGKLQTLARTGRDRIF